MTDWREAGIKADAHTIQRLWTQPFDGSAKAVVRDRVAAILRAVGGKVCLDLGGGGTSARVLKEAGMQVVSVDDGSMEMTDDHGHTIKAARKRRAHEYICAEIGVESRWGRAHHYASETDVAFYDFCGPWSENCRLAIEASRHMKAVAITLTTGHDIYSKATTQRERQIAYLAWLKDAWRPRDSERVSGLGQNFQRSQVRLIAEYATPTGHPVWVFLLSTGRTPIRHWNSTQRKALHPERERSYSQAAYQRAKSDPILWRQKIDRQNEWRRSHREIVNAQNRAAYRRKKGRLGPAGPA